MVLGFDRQGEYVMPISEAEAEALGRAWLEGRVKPEDFDERIKHWKSEEAIRQAIREGDVDQRQFVAELKRRSAAGTFSREMERFVDSFPITPLGGTKE